MKSPLAFAMHVALAPWRDVNDAVACIGGRVSIVGGAQAGQGTTKPTAKPPTQSPPGTT
jgi:hypothetical protein